jgi:hypothetical protein
MVLLAGYTNSTQTEGKRNQSHLPFETPLHSHPYLELSLFSLFFSPLSISSPSSCLSFPLSFEERLWPGGYHWFFKITLDFYNKKDDKLIVAGKSWLVVILRTSVISILEICRPQGPLFFLPKI